MRLKKDATKKRPSNKLCGLKIHFVNRPGKSRNLPNTSYSDLLDVKSQTSWIFLRKVRPTVPVFDFQTLVYLKTEIILKFIKLLMILASELSHAEGTDA